MLTTLHVHHSSLYISFPSLHDLYVIMKESVFLRIQVRANSQTKGLERGWKQRARLGRDAENTVFSSRLTRRTGTWDSRASRALRLLRHVLVISLLILKKIPAVLQSIMPTTFFSFPWTSIQSLALNSRKNCQHLTNWTRWNKQYKVCSSATSLFIVMFS